MHGDIVFSSLLSLRPMHSNDTFVKIKRGNPMIFDRNDTFVEVRNVKRRKRDFQKVEVTPRRVEIRLELRAYGLGVRGLPASPRVEVRPSRVEIRLELRALTGTGGAGSPRLSSRRGHTQLSRDPVRA